MTIFFTADSHFLHENVIEFSNRPFADLFEMTEALISNWNQVVATGDSVYHMGDFALSRGKKSAPAIDEILRRLNGQKFLIKGNHDRDEVVKNVNWIRVADYMELKHKPDRAKLLGVPTKIILCHYAMRVWRCSHHGAWMLFGHSHGNLVDIGGLSIDVGVDCHNYFPISLERVKELMADRSFLAVEHHQAGGDKE